MAASRPAWRRTAVALAGFTLVLPAIRYCSRSRLGASSRLSLRHRAVIRVLHKHTTGTRSKT